MIVKSYEVKKNLKNFLRYQFFLLYGENLGLKKDIKEEIKKIIGQEKDKLEVLSIYENEILNNEEILYDFIYSGSLFGNKKIVIIYDASNKLLKKIDKIFDKEIDDISIIIFSGTLETKSELRTFFEKSKKTICIPCYLDNERDLETIANIELKKNNISLSRQTINLLIEKSNMDRDNLRNELEKIKSYALNKQKIDFDEIKFLINFSGDYKSDIFINECLSGNILQYKKIMSELYANVVNQILMLRVLSNKVQRLLKIKEQAKTVSDFDKLINSSKPSIFWKEKPIVKKQLSIWELNQLKDIINKINDTELLCKKNPQASKAIFFNFFLEICKKANSSS